VRAFLTQRRKGAKETVKNFQDFLCVLLCAFAPLREKTLSYFESATHTGGADYATLVIFIHSFRELKKVGEK
jgi:hypothetical protein